MQELTRVELDIETGKVLYEWSSLDHVDPSGIWDRHQANNHS